MTYLIDSFNRKILKALQDNASIPQRELGERVGLSPNACWNRVQNLKKQGLITGQTVCLDREKLGLGLVVFVMIKTRNHSDQWLKEFNEHVSNLPEVVDFYRIGGEYDYLLKVVTTDMQGYDSFYRCLINGVDLGDVTASFAMEAIAEQRPLPI